MTLFCCGHKPPTYIKKPITKEQAEKIIANSVGIEKPEKSLYHTYEKTKQSFRYWKNSLEWKTSITNTLTMSKIDGNYVEGVVNSTNDGVISSPSPFFGRFNSKYLYIYITNKTNPWPFIAEYTITQNGRVLVYRKTVNSYGGYGTNLNLEWENTPKLDVDIYPNDKKVKHINKSTEYVSQTDD